MVGIPFIREIKQDAIPPSVPWQGIEEWKCFAELCRESEEEKRDGGLPEAGFEEFW
jgi:hypothetical protein